MIPKGKGMFLWVLDRLGTPETLTASLVAAGYDWVCVKGQNGTLLADGRTVADFEKQKPDEYIMAFRKAGISVHGWGYVYGYSTIVAREIDVTLKSIERFEFDSWQVDAEVEYKKSGVKMASRYMSNLRLALPNYTFGISTYRFPSLHRDFPFKPFVDSCDYASPQVYWEQAHNPAYQLDRCLKEYRELRADWPIVPAGSAYPAGTWAPTVAELDDFYDAVIKNKLDAWLWWECYYAKKATAWWDALSAHKSTVVKPPIPPEEIPTEPTDAEKLSRLWAAHPEVH